MDSSAIEKLRTGIRDVPDFPKPGIVFKDICPLLADPALLKLSVEALAEPMRGLKVDKIVAIDARGFIFAGALAVELGAGLVPVRKKGKLPWQTEGISYDLEYGSAFLEMQRDGIRAGETCWLVDDVLATGGTAAAATALISKLGGKLAGISFVVELSFLNGRARLPAGVPVHGVLIYSSMKTV